MNTAALTRALQVSIIGCLAVASVASGPLLTAPHTRLESSQPADGDTLTQSPQRVYLLFSGPVQPSLTQIVISAEGREIPLEPEGDPDDDRAILASAPDLASGTYQVTWATVSLDGHAVKGDFRFHLSLPELVQGAAAEATASSEESTPAESRAADAGDEGRGASGESSGVAYTLIKALSQGLLLALTGLLVFVAWVTPDAGGSPRRLILVLAAAAPAALIANLLLWFISIAPGSVDMGVVVAGLELGTGRLELARILLALLAFATLVLFGNMWLAALFALAATISGGALGHAATYQPIWSVPSKTVHLLAGSVWLGGLLLLIADRDDGASFARRASRVSSAALAAVIAITLTGLAQTLLIAPHVGELITSTYGAFVLVKVAGLAVLIAFGAWHRFRLLPRLAGDGGATALRSSTRWEAIVMLVVILVAGFLARIPPPETQITAMAPPASQVD